MFKMLVEIEKKAKEWYDLVIIDNLWKIKRDWHNEMEIQDRFTSDCQEIKNKYKNINIVIVHHEAKRVIKNSPWNMRGNQKIEDNSTIMIQIRRSFDPDDMPQEKRLLNIDQTKDTEWWVTARAGVYYNKSDYFDDYDPNWDK
jgi:broad specificity phosphatase PhoE